MSTEQTWTVEDLTAAYNLLLKFPEGDFSKPDFWTALGVSKELPDRFASSDPAVLVSLWNLILEKGKGEIKLFRSLMQDYVAAASQNRLLGEKMKNSIAEHFFGAKLAGKRAESEKSQDIIAPAPAGGPVVPSGNGTRYEFHVNTAERYPRLDLGQLARLAPPANLTKHFDDLDAGKQLVEKLQTANTAWKCIEIKAAEKKKPADIKIGLMRRELKMLQQCYNKSVSEISELYTRTSGDFERMRAVLKGEKVAGLWTDEEDVALRKPEDSVEFKRLLEGQGAEEVKKRRAFLGIIA